MKHTSVIALLGVAAALPLGAKVLPGVWKVNTAVPVPAPFVADSLDIKGTKYQPSVFLSAPMKLKAAKDAKLQSTDSLLTLSKPSEDMALQLLTSRLRSENYADGTLKVSCPSAFALYIDGKEQGKNETAKKDGTVSAPLKMEPDHDYEIAVKVLSAAIDTVSPQVVAEWVPTDDKRPIEIRLDAGMKRRVALDDTEMGERITRTALSPDGNWLLTYSSNRTDVDNTLNRWDLRNLRTGKVESFTGKPSLRWMPTSSRISMVEKGANGNDIILIDPKDMSRRTVATDIPAEASPVWALTEDKFYYVVTDEPKKQDGPLKRIISTRRAPGENDQSHIMEYDLATGAARPLTYGQAVSIADLAADGRHMLLISAEETPTKRPFTQTTLMELDTKTMKVDTIVPPTGFLSSASYSPDGKQLLILGSAALFDGIGQRIGSHPIANDFDVQAFIMDRATGRVTPISADFDPNIKSTEWNRADGNIYMLVEEGFDQPVYAYNPAKHSYAKLPLDVDVVSAFDMGDRGSALSYHGGDATHAGAAYVYDTKTRKNTLIADPLAERFAELDLQDGKQWKFTASDGTEIDGYLYMPPEFDASKKYPMIVYYYGGTSPSNKGIYHPYAPELFASRGYVVYVLNPSGTTGYGQEFAARHVNAWGKRTAEDIIEGVQKVAEEHPFIDKDKIGCLGASYGGFMTQYLQTLTPMFAAAVSHAGISNVTSYWGEGYWGVGYNGVAAADSYPWTDPELFTKQGSLFNADKIHTPLLLLHGTVDTNVPIGESIQLYNALKTLGREVEFVTVEGANHYVADYAKRKLWQNTIMAWFERWLKGDSAWWDALYK